MANDLNRVFLVARLTQDPELKQTSTGTNYVRFSVANNKSYVQGSGEKKEEVSYFNCVAWSKLAEIINQYCHKGKQVALEGRLKQNTWQDNEGKKQYAVDIVVENFQLLGSPSDRNSAQSSSFSSPAVSGLRDAASPNAQQESPLTQTIQTIPNGNSENFRGNQTPSNLENDDDIPF